MDPASADSTSPWWVVCLCAQWCNVCREWRDAFDQTAREHPQLRFAWVDVEDEDEAMGDVDIETFPTLLIAHGNRAVFFGPVQPTAGQLSRLIAGLTQSDTFETSRGKDVSAEAQALLARLQASVLPKP